MKLVELAIKAQENSYSPYSNARVGAALEMNDGTIYTGANIENAAFTPTVCAERTAIFKAVSEGYRKGDFKAIAVSASWEGLASPCGVCRQVFLEFFTEETKIYVIHSDGSFVETSLSKIIPGGFTEF